MVLLLDYNKIKMTMITLLKLIQPQTTESSRIWKRKSCITKIKSHPTLN
ncbi:unnamed protein product (macronuclear) [Paramecium tetraurelia]|uniref:Uncharacterized protein n=1 Tax=Paramecium tetraurelia TaxID=5888 RepID=A0CH21_PARTE|nr:uncharacterized protein GSPATT00007528001 [Paramecium tetraurelia]CAK70088.1 unnamed protein product [Paramecium tetraurelia]|eukprot:XP_001437485.1 hypothetical protein (macronuclear) [Paramecium tetraurelia strain d4-2]